MSVTFHEACVPPLLQGLRALSGVLGKAAAHAAATGTDPAALLQARLAPDMFPCVRQVQIASDFAKGAGAQLTGGTSPKHLDTETTLDELQARLARTEAYLATLPPAAFKGAERRELTVKAGPRELRFDGGRTYLLHFALPNFHFHATTAYVILRHGGVALGKPDFIGSLPA